MKTKFWNSEKLLSLTALLVSLLTLIVFVYQTNLIKQQQYKSVYPYLNLGNEYGGTLKYSYILKNEGIGPAFIESVKIYKPNSKVYHDFVDYVDDALKETDSIWYFHSNLTQGRLIPAKEKIRLIEIVNKDILEELGVSDFENLPLNTISGAKKLYNILNDDSLNIEITYKSIYDETWELQNYSIAPVKID